MLRAFQADSEEHDLFVIASVRILDEAVDIPRCDSEFIAHVGDRASDIRTVQRLQRGGRLDQTNPSKRNNLFLWTEEWSRAVNALTLMRQEDPLFHKKLRALSASYDRLGEPVMQSESRVRAEELQVYAKVRCLTIMEMFMKRVDERCAWYEKLGHEPRKNSRNYNEAASGRWLNNQRRLKNELPADRIAILEAVPGWSWGRPRLQRVYGEIAEGFCAMREKLGREPNERSSDPTEKFYAHWRRKQCSLKRKNELPADRIAILEAIPSWSWGKPYKPRKKVAYGEVAAEFCAMREKLGREPSECSSDPEERFYAQWRDNQRRSKNKNKLPADRIAILEAIPEWSWGKPYKPRKKVA